jgi:phosphoglycolate phosphatase
VSRFPWKLVLFDLDGTLVDSAPDIAEAVNRMLAELGLPRESEGTVRTWIGDGARVLLQRALRHAGSMQPVDDVMPRFMVHYGDCLLLRARVYPGVHEALDGLAALGVAMGLCTNKPQRFLPALLEAMGIAHHFQALVGGDTLAERKPSPVPLLHLAARLGEAPGDCLMVGDSAADADAARAAGMPLVLVRYGYPGTSAPAGALAMVDDLRELLEFDREGRWVASRSPPVA